MTDIATSQVYERQQSSDSGWDNPFRPDGDLSREADKIVNMIRGGKPITPTEENATNNGNIKRNQWNNDLEEKEETLTAEIHEKETAKNGTYSCQKAKISDGKGQTTNQISKLVVPGPTSASHVIIDEKRKKKGCCIIQ